MRAEESKTKFQGGGRGSSDGTIIIVPAVKGPRGRVLEPEKIYARRRYRDPKTGKLREKKRLVQSRTEGRETLHDLLDEIRREQIELVQPAGKTFADLADYYEKEYLHPPDKKGEGLKSWKKLKHPLNVLRNEFGDEPLSTIDYKRIDDFRKSYGKTPTRHKTERSLASVQRPLELLRYLLNIARVRNMGVVGYPFKEGERPLIRKTRETKRMRILTHAEEKKLLAAVRTAAASGGPDARYYKKLYSALIFAIDTAARAGEQFEIRVSDVNLADGYIRIREKTAKTGQERIVPITERNRKELLKQKPMRSKSTRHGETLIFDFKRPKRSFAAACKAAGIENFRWHDLRHTGTMRMLEAGVDPATAMKVTGHTNWTTFMRYVNLNAELMRNVASKLDQSRSKRKRAA